MIFNDYRKYSKLSIPVITAARHSIIFLKFISMRLVIFPPDNFKRCEVTKLLVFLFLVMNFNLFSQGMEENSYYYEVFLIDSYVTPEIPHTFVLSFFTSDSLKSKVIIGSKHEYEVSGNFSEDHKSEINISELKFDSLFVPFVIKLQGSDGQTYSSQVFELALPKTYEIKFTDTPGFLSTCCLGGIIFGLPAPNFIIKDGKSHFSLTKDIPILTYYSGGYNYPSYYLDFEYTYRFDNKESITRLGFKKIFIIDFIEFISPGVSYFYSFDKYHGVSPEISIGWFKISTVFTLYSNYRYNFDLKNPGDNFQEISVGLYSSFFSINL